MDADAFWIITVSNPGVRGHMYIHMYDEYRGSHLGIMIYIINYNTKQKMLEKGRFFRELITHILYFRGQKTQIIVKKGPFPEHLKIHFFTGLKTLINMKKSVF